MGLRALLFEEITANALSEGRRLAALGSGGKEARGTRSIREPIEAFMR